ncbi:MAG: NADH:flavin oxidoreductase/NADH oxidase [Thermoplasmata archaeon]
MKIFDPIVIRGKKARNRIMMSPMCMYSSNDGSVNDFHILHYATRSMGGAGIIMIEANAVDYQGMISPNDLRLDSKEKSEKLNALSKIIESYGGLSGIQLAHAGRKAGSYPPGKGRGKIPIDKGGWKSMAPSSIPYRDSWDIPEQMDKESIAIVIKKFAESARLAAEANIDIIEIHAAHGYLIHEFLSPITNKRNDNYGRNIENRSRFLIEIVNEVRANIPESMPLFVRISGNDFVEGGWTIEDSVILSKMLYANGVDLIDCSSGGIAPGIRMPKDKAFNLPVSSSIKKDCNILTSVVGNLDTIETMQSILENGQADMVTLGRLLLRDPYWPSRLAYAKTGKKFFPEQYTDGFRDLIKN